MVAAVCRRYGASYESIAPRVQKTMVKALRDAGKPLTTHYGEWQEGLTCRQPEGEGEGRGEG